LHPDAKLGPELKILEAASASSGVPYRICETNSFCGGGKPAVSDTYGAALRALDFMLRLAWAGAAGVNMQTGMNQLGWVSWYSPIGDDQHGGYAAKPEYYGMLSFGQAVLGERLALDLEDGGLNLTAYATGDKTEIRVTVVNKDANADTSVTVTCDRKMQRGDLIRLTAPSLESKHGVTLGGRPVNTEGKWRPNATPVDAGNNGDWKILVRAGSAAILSLYSA
jgi:hypothetical protein